MKKRVLILSSTASAINYINSLKDQEDVELHVTDANPLASGLYYPDLIPHIISRSRNLDEYQKDLDKLIADHAIDCLIPTSDHDVEGVIRLLSKGWAPPVRMFQPHPDVYELCSSKDRLIGFFQDKDEVPVPRIYDRGEPPELPCVIKPTREGGGKDVWVVEEERDLEKKKGDMQRKFGQDFTIQEYIPGGTGTIYMVVLLFDQRGELLVSEAMRSTLTYMTWGGGGNAGKIVAEPELEKLGEKVVRMLGGWRGPICLEFKKDSQTGIPKLMEINCRLNGYSYLLTMNGIDLPRAILDVLFSEKKAVLKNEAASKDKNFILGFRERLVKEWVN